MTSLIKSNNKNSTKDVYTVMANITIKQKQKQKDKDSKKKFSKVMLITFFPNQKNYISFCKK